MNVAPPLRCIRYGVQVMLRSASIGTRAGSQVFYAVLICLISGMPAVAASAPPFLFGRVNVVPVNRDRVLRDQSVLVKDRERARSTATVCNISRRFYVRDPLDRRQHSSTSVLG